MSRKVLVVDDEKLIVKGIRFNLEQDGMEVDCAYDGEEAVEKAKENKYDIILLDLMLPKMDGLEVCQQIREFSNVPIVMLTAKGEDMDKILGLDYGADDYITKPFSLKLVLMRIEAVLRRTKEKVENHNIFISHGIKLDTNRHTVEVNGKEINLTQLEFDILEVFMKHRNQVLTRDNLINQVWGYDFTGDEKAVNIHVMNLRRKLDIDCIQTIRGVGYKFESED